TWEKAKRPTARGLSLSTNQNPVKEAATGQRQLMFHVAGRTEYRGGGFSVTPEFMGRRAEIWSEVVADLRALVNALGKADLNETEKFRGADFATLMKAAAKCEGWEAEAKQMLAEMAGMQVRVVADKNLGVSVL